jgi:lipopolysaccharide biosynthesis glycosyltransferase
MMKNKINVVFCIDKSYVQPLGITLVSLLINNRTTQPTIYVVAPSLDPDDLTKLKTVVEPFGAELIFRQGEDPRVSKFKEHLHISRATYYRLLLPEILADVEKAIYLDCDLIVETDLLSLWEIDLEDKGCAGVDEVNTPHASRLGQPLDSYLNAGVLLLNLAYWRDHDVMNNCLTWLADNPERASLLEQDAINVVLIGHKVTIDRMWNLNPAPERNLDTLTQYPERIIHFAGPLKPWHKHFDFELQDIYRKYVNLTPWAKGYQPAEPRNTAQACLIANQMHKRGDYKGAARYYQTAIDFMLRTKPLDSKLLLDCINGGHRHSNSQDYVSACEHYRSCLEHWGLPIDYDSVYNIPGTLDGVY